MNDKATPAERLNAIVEQGLCIGCGLCQSVAGKNRIRVTKTLNGYLTPVVEGELDHETVDRIYAVCPGTRVEGLPEKLVEPDTHHDNVWGPGGASCAPGQPIPSCASRARPAAY